MTLNVANQRNLCIGVSQVGGKFIMACGFALVLCQTATAVLVEDPETVLRAVESLVGGKPVEARGLALVLRQTAEAVLVEKPQQSRSR